MAFSESAIDIAKGVSSGEVLAVDVVSQALKEIAHQDPHLTCFVSVTAEQALEAARKVDDKRARGETLGPLAGVPFAVKDLFDVRGEITKAGAKMRETAAPASQDAPLVARLKAADAICLGRLNMDEFAYGFATVNANYGTTRNPHDPDRLAGGSSGGSAASVAAGMLPLTLGSDTNGSVRVPASLCGLFGLRPTHDSLPMDGVFPFVDRLDTIGPFTRTLEELEVAHWVLADKTAPPRTKRKLKVARLDGWFRANCFADTLAGVDAIADAFGDAPLIDLPLAGAARSAGFLITAKLGGALHLEDLKTRAMDYDPAVRDRLIAGVALSDSKVNDAEIVAERFNRQLDDALRQYDILIAPTTPTPAPKISEGLIEIDGEMVSARANLGLYTQPVSLSGLPILSVPLKRPGQLPLGVQLIAGHGKEAHLFSAAERLVKAGLIGSDRPQAKWLET
ncbi:MAG: AtzE family amidohydrolase [Henriciella sp.]